MNQHQLRVLVGERDHGVCARCQRDVAKLRADYWDEVSEAHARHAQALAEGADPYGEERRLTSTLMDLREMVMRLGFTRKDLDRAQLWDAHHILALEDGGTNDLRNAETVCLPCHRRLTREQNAIRRRKPSKRLAVVGEDRNGKVVVRQ